MPWLMFQSAGHLVTSMLKPPGPTYRSLLFGSTPYLPEPASGMTLSLAAPRLPPAAVVVAPAVVVAATVVVAPAVVAGATVVAPLLPPLLSLRHAAAGS